MNAKNFSAALDDARLRFLLSEFEAKSPGERVSGKVPLIMRKKVGADLEKKTLRNILGYSHMQRRIGLVEFHGVFDEIPANKFRVKKRVKKGSKYHVLDSLLVVCSRPLFTP